MTPTVDYTALGLRAIRVWGIDPITKRCRCNRPDCQSPGKHPVRAGWTGDDDHMIDHMEHNVGLVMGGESRVVAIDLDGQEGIDTWTRLLSEHPPLVTRVSITGGGGEHWLLRVPRELDISKIKNSVRVRPGIDVRATNGFIVAPPSKHVSSNEYTWRDTSTAIADMPRWVYDLLTKPLRLVRGKTPEDRVRQAPEGERNTTLFKETCRLFSAAARAGVEADLEGLRAAAREAGLEDPEIEGTVLSASNRTPSSDDLDRGEHGIKKINANLERILRTTPELKDCFRYNTLADVIEHRGLPFPTWSAEWTDNDTIGLQIWITNRFNIEFKTLAIDACVKRRAYECRYDPLQDYLRGLVWDGISRVDMWAVRYLGAADTPYNRLVGRKFLLGCVARAMLPGCKLDTMLVLEGLQGAGKQLFLEALGGQWYSDSLSSMDAKTGGELLRGWWIMEVPELQNFRRDEEERRKAFITARYDRFRPAFARNTVSIPRRVALVGTTNSSKYLLDTTGNRRYLPIECGELNVAGMRRDRDQVWAEVMSLFMTGESCNWTELGDIDHPWRWWLTTEQDRGLAREEQGERRMEDPWEVLIEKYVQEKQEVTTEEIFEFVLQKLPKDRTRGDQMKIGEILRMLKFKRVRMTRVGMRHWVYVRPLP